MGALVAVFAAFAATAQESIVISAGDCARVVAHVPDADVAYEAGVDARGRAVAPADLDDGGRLDVDGTDVAVGIAIPLRAVPGIPGDETRCKAAGGKIHRFAADARVGTVTLSDGDVYFDDRRLTSRELELLAALCRDR